MNVVIVFSVVRSLDSKSSCDRLLQKGLKRIHKHRYYEQAPVRDTKCYSIVFARKEQCVARIAVFNHTTDGHDSEVRYAGLPPADKPAKADAAKSKKTKAK